MKKLLWFLLWCLWSLTVPSTWAQTQGFILPHLPLSGGWHTEVILANYGTQDSPGVLAFYSAKAPSGLLTVSVQSGIQDPSLEYQYPFRLVPKEMRTLILRGATGLESGGGYMIVSAPTTRIQIFWVWEREDGEVKWEAPLIPQPYNNWGFMGATSFTAVALLNVGSSIATPATAVLKAINFSGDVVAETPISLKWGENVVCFLWQLFPGLPASFQGTLVVQGSPLVIIAKNFF